MVVGAQSGGRLRRIEEGGLTDRARVPLAPVDTRCNANSHQGTYVLASTALQENHNLAWRDGAVPSGAFRTYGTGAVCLLSYILRLCRSPSLSANSYHI